MSQFTDFQNSQLLPDEYDMRATRPESSLVSRDAAATAAAAADDEFKLFVTAKAAAAAPSSPEMQRKLIEFAILFDRLNKGLITPFDFEEQIADLDLNEEQKQLARMLCVEKLDGGKKKSRYSKTNKMRRSKSRSKSNKRSNKRSKSRSNKRYRSRK